MNLRSSQQKTNQQILLDALEKAEAALPDLRLAVQEAKRMSHVTKRDQAGSLPNFPHANFFPIIALEKAYEKLPKKNLSLDSRIKTRKVIMDGKALLAEMKKLRHESLAVVSGNTLKRNRATFFQPARIHAASVDNSQSFKRQRR